MGIRNTASRLTWLSLLGLSYSIAQAEPPVPVILISVDTLRADHVGCYQAGKSLTPGIDALAKSGTIFSQVSTPFPLTLPAHVALFTSQYPFATGVEDNGIPLSPGAVTLATVFKKSGYRTSAFVGSYVLDRRFGLNQGFDVYDGPLDVHHKTSSGSMEHKRSGDQVAAAAKHWLESNSNAPFFLFLHLYDLHTPYNLPADPSQRHGEAGYAAELAYVDNVLADFLGFLEHRGLLQRALIVFTSDHGEGLGEHGENSHGYFDYQSTVRVPLIIHWPAGLQRISESHVDNAASLMDVAPTILEAVGLKQPATMRGRSLLGKGGDDAGIYSETVYARNHFGCAPLESLRIGAYKYIHAPKPELYDLSNDPAEQRNIYTRQRSKADAMLAQTEAIRADSRAPGVKLPASPKSDSGAVLRSLGYLSGPASSSARGSHVDPKDRIVSFEDYSHALALSSGGDLIQANRLLEKLVQTIPDIADVRMSLGLNQQRQGNNAEAARNFLRAIDLAPSNAPAHFELGLTYFRMGKAAEAISEFKTALRIEPWYTRADEALAEIYIHNQNLPQARQHLEHLLVIDPDSYTAHYNLGIFAAMANNWNQAQQQMEWALRSDPGSAEAHKTLGMILQKQGKDAEAAEEFKAAETTAR